MDPLIETAILFVVSLLISAIIIYFVTKIFGETEGFGTALLAAFVGAIIYTVVYYIFGSIADLTGLKWLASILGGLGWLAALRMLYKIGWLKALGLAIVIWVLSAIIGFFLPGLATTGPL
jgi:Na+/melibiose symporter-like transporter